MICHGLLRDGFTDRESDFAGSAEVNAAPDARKAYFDRASEKR